MSTSDTNSQKLDSVPADHQDLYHPHFPGDLEQQATTRRLCVGKKDLWLAGGVLTTILLIVAAFIWGDALTKHSDKSVKNAEVPVVANSSIPTPFEVQTVYENVTTFVYTTTRVPLVVAPLLATSTILLSPTPRAQVMPEAPLRPIQTMTAPTITMSEAPAPAPTPSVTVSDKTSTSNCLFSGAWVLKEQCMKHCPAWEGYNTHCEVSKRSQWVCVSCPL